MPGDIVVGTDSHTCTAGALGTFAFGVGSTDMANTWYTKDIRVSVPESVRFHVTGTLKSGIAAKDIDRLFVEFQQLEAGAAKKHAGTGLGLALTRRLVEAQGGTVGVQSELGKGSVFHAILPRKPLAHRRSGLVVAQDVTGATQAASPDEPKA